MNLSERSFMMSNIAEKVEKTDHKDYGPMGNYDSPDKPECPKCYQKTFVTSTGKSGLWKWTCTSCVVEIEP